MAADIGSSGGRALDELLPEHLALARLLDGEVLVRLVLQRDVAGSAIRREPDGLGVPVLR